VDRSWEYIDLSKTHECENWDMRPGISFSRNTQIEISLQCTSGNDAARNDINDEKHRGLPCSLGAPSLNRPENTYKK
jgi:hypothetical protein